MLRQTIRTQLQDNIRYFRSLRERELIFRYRQRGDARMQVKNSRAEKGVALLLSILALLLLTGVAVAMMYMSSTEAVINSNFKAEETEYFAARAGVQEIRDRMIPGVAPYSINALLPVALPGGANGGVLYILQNGVAMANVTGGNPNTNPNFDDELCHDFSFGGALQQQP